MERKVFTTLFAQSAKLTLKVDRKFCLDLFFPSFSCYVRNLLNHILNQSHVWPIARFFPFAFCKLALLWGANDPSLERELFAFVPFSISLFYLHTRRAFRADTAPFKDPRPCSYLYVLLLELPGYEVTVRCGALGRAQKG